MPIQLAAALNGSRALDEHPAIPRTPEALAEAARTSVEAGADLLHVHAFDDSGAETLAPEPCAAVLRAIRAACPNTPVSLTTSAAIEADPQKRFELISAWVEPPDLVTANQGESGIVELCDHLLQRGIGIEAGLLSLSDAEAFVRSGLADRCDRVLVEPLDSHPVEAVEHAAAIEAILRTAGVCGEQMHHGDGFASWAVCRRAVPRGYGIRTGLEDTTVLPDGGHPADNAALVRAAMSLLEGR